MRRVKRRPPRPTYAQLVVISAKWAAVPEARKADVQGDRRAAARDVGVHIATTARRGLKVAAWAPKAHMPFVPALLNLPLVRP